MFNRNYWLFLIKLDVFASKIIADRCANLHPLFMVRKSGKGVGKGVRPLYEKNRKRRRTNLIG